MKPFAYKVDQKSIKRLSQLTPWKTAAAIVFDWTVIVAAIAISEYFANPLAWMAAIIVIGGRMHAFGTLIHDFAHYRFISNKQVSDWVGDVLLAWPILTTVDGYRRNHLAHHRYTNTDEDPDWVIKLGTRQFTFPQEWTYAISNILGYLVLVSSVRDLRSLTKRLNNAETPFSYRLIRVGFYLAVGLILVATDTWVGFLMYWVAPFFTFFLFFLYVRSVAEHFGSMDYDHELTSSRTVYPHFWERAFFAPHNVNYHLDHHLYPSVPFYRLKDLHALLLADPDYARLAHRTRGYSTGLVRECLAEGREVKGATA